jgi:STE24 endopeptidase
MRILFPRRGALTLAEKFFSSADVARARRYHRSLYWAGAVGLLIDAGVLAVFAWTSVGRAFDPASLEWWMRTPMYAALLAVAVAVARMPLAWWFGLVRERRWRFSTQQFSDWAVDHAKAIVVEALIAALVLLGLVALARALPGWWVVPAAVALALFALLFSFVAPVVLEPLFNRFVSLEDERLGNALRGLAARSGVSVRDVLVQDTSRRTRKANAYVSGLGKTRRIVVADTLLEHASAAEVRVVVAHELGHVRQRHVLLATLLSMGLAGTATVVLWALLGTTIINPHRLPLVLLIGFALTLIFLPARSGISRRWERSADRDALCLTGDADAYRATMRRLAQTNLSDLAPPALVYLLLFTHPTPAERIAAASSR